MVKYLLLISIVLLSGCTQYQYNISYEKCNGQTGSLTVKPLVILNGCDIELKNGFLYDSCGSFKKSNVCDFSYTRSAIQ